MITKDDKVLYGCFLLIITLLIAYFMGYVFTMAELLILIAITVCHILINPKQVEEEEGLEFDILDDKFTLAISTDENQFFIRMAVVDLVGLQELQEHELFVYHLEEGKVVSQLNVAIEKKLKQLAIQIFNNPNIMVQWVIMSPLHRTRYSLNIVPVVYQVSTNLDNFNQFNNSIIQAEGNFKEIEFNLNQSMTSRIFDKIRKLAGVDVNLKNREKQSKLLQQVFGFDRFSRSITIRHPLALRLLSNQDFRERTITLYYNNLTELRMYMYQINEFLYSQKSDKYQYYGNDKFKARSGVCRLSLSSSNIGFIGRSLNFQQFVIENSLTNDAVILTDNKHNLYRSTENSICYDINDVFVSLFSANQDQNILATAIYFWERFLPDDNSKLNIRNSIRDPVLQIVDTLNSLNHEKAEEMLKTQVNLLVQQASHLLSEETTMFVSWLSESSFAQQVEAKIGSMIKLPMFNRKHNSVDLLPKLQDEQLVILDVTNLDERSRFAVFVYLSIYLNESPDLKHRRLICDFTFGSSIDDLLLYFLRDYQPEQMIVASNSVSVSNRWLKFMDLIFADDLVYNSNLHKELFPRIEVDSDEFYLNTYDDRDQVIVKTRACDSIELNEE
jgi:hypothetical protein